MPSVVQKRPCAKGKSMDTANTCTFSKWAAFTLNLRTDVAHTEVSRLGKIFNITRLPLRLPKDNSLKSPATAVKSGAISPFWGIIPFVCTAVPLNVTVSNCFIVLFYCLVSRRATGTYRIAPRLCYKYTQKILIKTFQSVNYPFFRIL